MGSGVILMVDVHKVKKKTINQQYKNTPMKIKTKYIEKKVWKKYYEYYTINRTEDVLIPHNNHLYIDDSFKVGSCASTLVR